MVIPVWIRIVFFGIAAAVALLPFFLRSRKIGFGWLVALVWGALSFSSVYIVQIPVQKDITSALVGSGFPQWARSALYILPSGVIQEFAKALFPIMLLLVGLRLGTSRKFWGPAAGAGFALTEAVIIVGIISAPVGTIALVERFSATIFHVGMCSLAVGEGRLRRFVWGLPMAMLVHSFWNYVAVSLIGKIGYWPLEAVIGAGALIVWGIAIKLSWKGE